MSDFSERLLDWYDRNARVLPWRVSPADRKAGRAPDPYHVWLSEIMLQQTTVPHGIRYFERFITLWPDIHSLAAASRDDILREWAGLGYYARARNLHACAQEVVRIGAFPDTSDDLVRLPGIGPYTAGAIAAIAFDRKAAAIDGNVERVFSRLLALSQPVRDSKSVLRSTVESRLPDERAGDFAQALMDLGATVCTPRSPSCDMCPVREDCRADKDGQAERYPVKAEKKARPDRYGQVFIILDGEFIRLERRPEQGLLGGMMGLPTTEWTELPPETSAEKPIGRVRHVFTHFRLTLDVIERREKRSDMDQWIPLRDIGTAGLPSVFSKAVKLWLSSREQSDQPF